MSLIVSSSSSQPHSANPTAGLIKALRDFDKALSDRQRLVFKGNYTKPGPADVVAFVSLIDANNKSRARKCVAPRLCSFLECTVRFTSVVDTFIQADPTVAALVWGGVKTAILAASNHASYFEKITEMIMNIGRTSPVYQKFGDLYPGAIGLQTALSEYYTTVIRLCIKVIQVSERHGFLSALSPIFNPFENDFKDLLRNLQQNSRDIDIQIALASHKADQDEHKLAEVERKENKIHRRLVSRMGEDLKASTNQMRMEKLTRQVAKIRMTIQEALCPIDYVQEWRRIKREHLAGTADWYLQDTEYLGWSTSSDTSILWCSGKLGSGKTVLLSSMIANFFEKRETDQVIAYFFCRTDDAKTLASRAIFGSICRQLLESRHADMTLDQLIAFSKKLDNIDTKGLIDLLLEHLPAGKSCFIVLDGLDECEPDQVVDIGRALAQLSKQPHCQLRIICASRPELESALFRHVKPRFRLNLSDQSIGDDIRCYVASTIEICITEGQLALGDQMIKDEIIEALHKGAHGMFLWAKLVIDELCTCGSDAEILVALRNLPRQLSDIYDRKMQRISAQRANSKSIEILKICCVARRPLGIKELQEVLSVEKGQTYLIRSKMPSNMYRTIATCEGLVQVDEEDEMTRFLHHSVRQYLIETCTSFPTLENLDKSFGYLCLTYLNFGDFEKQITGKNSALAISPLDLGSSAASQNQIIAKLAEKRFDWRPRKSSSKFEVDVRTLQSIVQSSRSYDSQGGQYHFFVYAQEHWIHHLGCLHPLDGDAFWGMFCSLVAKQHILGSVDGRDFPKPEDHHSLQEFAMTHDHAAVAKYSIDQCRADDSDFKFVSDLMKLLVRASAMGKIHLRWLLLREIMLADVCNEFWPKMGHIDFVERFLRACSMQRLAGLPLHIALEKIFVRQALVDTLDTLDALNALDVLDLEYRQTIWILTQSGHLMPSTSRLEHLLHYSILWSDSELFLELLEQNPSITSSVMRDYGGSLLVATLMADNPAMLNGLLFRGAALPRSEREKTVLLLSVERGSYNIVRDELFKGADPNSASADALQNTPLRAAIQAQNVAMAELLLENGANPQNKHHTQVTPMMLACQMNSFDIALLLYDAGATLGGITYREKELLFDHAIEKDRLILRTDLFNRGFCVCDNSLPDREAIIKRVIRLCNPELLLEISKSQCASNHIYPEPFYLISLIQLISRQSTCRREMFSVILQQSGLASTRLPLIALLNTVFQNIWSEVSREAREDFLQVESEFLPN